MKKYFNQIATVFVSSIVVVGIVSAATTISTNINTGGALNVTGTSTLMGNVGVATNAPLSKLDVNGGVAIGSYAATNAAPSNGLIVSGNVGIGTTNPGSMLAIGAGTGASTPRQTITINNAGSAVPSAANATSFGDKLVWWNSGTYKAAMGMASSEYWFQSSAVNTHFSFYGGTAASPSEILRLNASGGLALGNSYVGTDPGAGNMIISDNVGIGTTTPASKLTVNGHIGTNGSAPTITSAGTSPSITVGSTDTAGEFTEGSISTGAVITFATAYPRAPFCTLSAESGLAFSYVITSTTITVTNIGALSSTAIQYNCIANENI